MKEIDNFEKDNIKKKNFSNLIKQIIKTESFNQFEKIINKKKLSHAYLVTCEDELYNKKFCQAIALKLACEKTLPCFECSDCLKVISKFHPDILTYPQNQNFLVDDSISIVNNAYVKPMILKYKIFIINNIDKSTIQAQNKILKILEETPNNVIFFLNTTDMNNVLQTIISRTTIIQLKPLDAVTMVKILKEITGKIDYNAINFGSGWLGKTLLLTNEKIALEYKSIISMLSEMKNSKVIIDYIDFFSEKSGFLNRLNFLQNIMEKILYAHFFKSDNEKIQILVKDYNVETIYEIFNLIIESKKQFDANVNTNLITDYLLFKILEVKYLCSLKK